MLFGVGVLCRVLYSIVGYLYISCCERVGAWEGLRYVIVALTWPSI